jgi:hypothetical protein
LSLQDFWIAYGEHRLTLSRLCFSLFFGRGFVDPLLLVSAFVRKHTRQAAPFFVLGFYGCAYAVLVTLGRAENGYNDWFLTSRYTTSALALTLAVIGLGLRERQNRTGGRSGAAYQVLLTVVLVLALANSAAGFRLAKGEATLRLASMRLLDYADVFDSAVDGMATGPFYALCPIDGSRVLDWGVAPARKAGFIPGLRQVVPEETVQGSLHHESGHRQVWYLAHKYSVERLSGIVKPREGFHPDLVLIRRAKDRYFSAFGLLDRDHWQIDLSMAMARRIPDPVEVFALETATGHLAQLAQ